MQTIAELCLSPVGLSVTTKLAPARFAGQMLGLWFLATAVGNALNVYVTKLSTSMSEFSYYFSLGAVAVGIGLLIFLGARKINLLMGDLRTPGARPVRLAASHRFPTRDAGSTIAPPTADICVL